MGILLLVVVSGVGGVFDQLGRHKGKIGGQALADKMLKKLLYGIWTIVVVLLLSLINCRCKDSYNTSKVIQGVVFCFNHNSLGALAKKAN